TAPPWTFTAPAVGAIVLVTDAFTAGDRFQVFDFGSSLGLTSLPSGSADCGDDPVPCLATAGISKGSFALPSGNHSITINPVLSLGGGSGYLRVDAVPEPGTWAMLASGLGALFFWRRRGVQAARKRLVSFNRKTLLLLACVTIAAGVWFEQRAGAQASAAIF